MSYVGSSRLGLASNITRDAEGIINDFLLSMVPGSPAGTCRFGFPGTMSPPDAPSAPNIALGAL